MPSPLSKCVQFFLSKDIRIKRKERKWKIDKNSYYSREAVITYYII